MRGGVRGGRVGRGRESHDLKIDQTFSETLIQKGDRGNSTPDFRINSLPQIPINKLPSFPRESAFLSSPPTPHAHLPSPAAPPSPRPAFTSSSAPTRFSVHKVYCSPVSDQSRYERHTHDASRSFTFPTFHHEESLPVPDPVVNLEAGPVDYMALLRWGRIEDGTRSAHHGPRASWHTSP